MSVHRRAADEVTLVIIFGLLALVFNFIWESWHAVYLYQGFGMGFPARMFVHVMSFVSCIDAIILMIIVLSGAILWKDPIWYFTMSARKYSYFIGVSVLWALVIEVKGVYLLHEWQYSDLMPIVAGVGASPLIQLATTGLLALAVIRHLAVREARRT